jgi:hypothetical protein
LAYIANLISLSGVAAGSTNLGTFTGTTIPDSSTIKAALQSLETAVESISVTPDFADDQFRISDNGDSTKKIAFEASGITTATTRTVTMPDANVDLADVNTAIQRDGSVAFTADQSMGNNKITNLAAPIAGNDAARKVDLDNAIEGVKPKEAVLVATTTNITLSGEQTIDGVLTSASRVLVKNQTNPEENGIYDTDSSTWIRSSDFDQLTDPNEIKGSYVAVMSGTTNAGKIFVCNSDPTVLDTDPITFVHFNSITTLVAGNGVSLTGTTLDVDHDGEGLTFSSTQLALELDGSTLSKSASGLKVADSGITVTQLADNSVSTTKIQNDAVDEDKIVSAALGSGLTGGSGTIISVTSSPLVQRTVVAGEAFAANTSFLVRWAKDGETAERAYKADLDASAADNFYIIGIAFSAAGATAGDNLTMVSLGEYVLKASDTPFNAADIGKPVFLDASGAFTVDSTFADDEATARIGMVQSTSKIWVQIEIVGVN